MRISRALKNLDMNLISLLDVSIFSTESLPIIIKEEDGIADVVLIYSMESDNTGESKIVKLNPMNGKVRTVEDFNVFETPEDTPTNEQVSRYCDLHDSIRNFVFSDKISLLEKKILDEYNDIYAEVSKQQSEDMRKELNILRQKFEAWCKSVNIVEEEIEREDKYITEDDSIDIFEDADIDDSEGLEVGEDGPDFDKMVDDAYESEYESESETDRFEDSDDTLDDILG